MKRRRGWPTGQLTFIALLGLGALLAHLVDGYAWCQEYWNWDGKRHSSTDGRRWPANDGVVITYINGIFHSVPEWESITQQLQALFGHEVRSFYNPSSGWWITDASKAGYHMLRKPANHTIAQALGDHLAQAVEDVGRGRVLHIAHSGGALITYLAAQHHLTRRQRDKIDVVTFGGARSITRKYFSGRVVNYYARNDPLVKLDRRAAELMKLTNNTKFQEISEKHNTTFVFLEGRARQFVLDHSLEGPTYQHALMKEAKAFRRAHFGPLSPLSWDYDQSILRLVRKKVAQLSGLHDFFSTERFGLRSIRKSVARLTGLHGFFSGKNPGSKGVAVSVFGSGKGAAAADAEGSGVSTGVTSWWKPWGRRSDDGNDVEVVVVPDAAAAAGAEGGAPGAGASERFWLGFRWSRRGRKGQSGDEAEEGTVPTGSVVVDLVERSQISMDTENGQSQEPRSTSRWARVRGAWVFSRAKESNVAGELAASEDGGLSDSSVEAEEDKEASGKGRLDSSTLAESSDRPWLSVGWTPWGGRTTRPPPGEAGDAPASAPASTPESRVEEATLSAEHGGAAAGEREAAATSAAAASGAAGVAPAVGEEAGGSADGARIVEVGSADVSAEEDEKALPPRDDSSYLRRWWPSSSSSSSSGIGNTIGVPEEVDGGGDPGGGESVVAGSGEAAKAEKVIVATSPGDGGDESLEVTEREAAEGGGEPSQGTGGEQAERPDGPVAVEQEQDASLSLLRRWWPVSKQEPTSPDEARFEEDSVDDVTAAENATCAEVGPEVGVLSAGLAHASADGGASGPQKLPAEQLPELLPAQPGREDEGVEEQQQQRQHQGEGSSASAMRPPLMSRFWDVFFNRPLELPLPTTQEESLNINVSADGDGSDALATARDAEGNDVVAAESAEGGAAGAEGVERDGDQGESKDEEVFVADVLRPADGDIPPPPPRIDDSAQTPSSVEEGAGDEVTPEDDEGRVGAKEEEEDRREEEQGAGKEGNEDGSRGIEEQDERPSEGRDSDDGSGGEDDVDKQVQPVGQKNEVGVIRTPAKKERVMDTGGGSGRR